MNKKTQSFSLIGLAILLILTTLLPLSSKVALVVILLAGVLLFLAFSLIICSQKKMIFHLALFLLCIVAFNLFSGIILHKNHQLINSPSSRYFLPSNTYTNTAYDGVYFSFTTFTSVGNTDILPLNQTARASALLIGLCGYLSLAVLVVLLQRGLKPRE